MHRDNSSENYQTSSNPARAGQSESDREIEHQDSPPVKDLGVKTGVVKSFGEYAGKPGIGHIFDSNNNEYFVHFSQIAGSGFKNLARGQHVKFHAYEGPKGLYAEEIRVIMV